MAEKAITLFCDAKQEAAISKICGGLKKIENCKRKVQVLEVVPRKWSAKRQKKKAPILKVNKKKFKNKGETVKERVEWKIRQMEKNRRPKLVLDFY